MVNKGINKEYIGNISRMYRTEQHGFGIISNEQDVAVVEAEWEKTFLMIKK